MTIRYRHILLSLLLFIAASAWALPPESYADNSVLSKGKWMKAEIKETGVYKITFDELKKWGFDNPDNVGVYGYGGHILSESLLGKYIDDLPEVAVWKEKGNDGVFNSGDYLLFYGKGLIKWGYKNNAFEHTNNHYATKTYYFLHQKESEKGKEMAAKTETSLSNFVDIESFDDYYLHEEDRVSPHRSGRELVGENFGVSKKQNFAASLPGIVPDATGKVTLSFYGPGSAAASNTLSINGESVLTMNLNSTLKTQTVNWTDNNKKESNTVTIEYDKANTISSAYLNYFRIQYKRKLQPSGGFLLFRSTDAINSHARFTIGNTSTGTMVWDVSDGENPMSVPLKDGGSSKRYFDAEADQTLHEFVLVDKTKSMLSVANVKEIENQNLHKAGVFYDMFIIAQPAFMKYAEQLAQEHQTRDNLRVLAVTPETIYNEFSSGTPDASAYRRFIKMFFDRSGTPDDSFSADAPKYLLLYGDGAYDNRFVSDVWKRVDSQNFLLTYQSEESAVEYSTYVSDDYFGFLSDADEELSMKSKKINLGIGRFPVRTDAQAKNILAKTIAYMDNKTLGDWKNNLVWIADDGTARDGYSDYDDYMRAAEEVTKNLEAEHPEFINNKVYLDAFQKKTVAGKGTYPDARNKLYGKIFKEGMLILNYMGHGGTTALSDEVIVSMTDVKTLSYPQWPLWITSACDFARFDDVSTSAGEEVALNPKGAGIALFTTTRSVIGASALKLNKQFINYLFEKKDGRRLTLGETMRNAKRGIDSDDIKLHFMLLGNPAMKLAYPEYTVRVDSINGVSIDEIPELQLRALESITVSGRIINPDGNLDPSFTGELAMKIFDSQDTITCLNNDKNSRKVDNPQPFKYFDYPSRLFVSKDSIFNGEFKFTFLVPKDISYSNKPGKMNFYAHHNDGVSVIEAQGAFLDFVVGGANEDIEDDTDGPEIKELYLNDPSFKPGATVNETPLLIARVYDESGINISGSGIGHDIIVKIDNQNFPYYSVNDFFQFLTGSYQEGYLSFSVPELTAGRHTLELSVWDLQNNITIQEIEFEVEPGLRPDLLDLMILPNPVKDRVTFSISHNRPEASLEIGIYVYDLTGRIVWQYKEQGESDALSNYTVEWDLIAGGGRLRSGIYLVKAAINTKGSKTASKAKKMVVLAQ